MKTHAYVAKGEYERLKDELFKARESRDALALMLSKLLRAGVWYNSAIELDHDQNGERLENEVLVLLDAHCPNWRTL